MTSQANVEFLTVFACVDFTGRETKKLCAQFHSQEDQSEEFLFLKKVTLKNGKKVPHVQKCVIFFGGGGLSEEFPQWNTKILLLHFCDFLQ